MEKTNKAMKAFTGNSKGVSAIEVIIALAILGIVAVAFLGGLSTALNATSIADERSVAQSLAQSQMEYIKSQEYDDSEHPLYDVISDIPDGYTIYGYDESHPDWFAQRLDPEGDGLSNDDGLQVITVTVKHHDKEVLTLEGYKLDR